MGIVKFIAGFRNDIKIDIIYKNKLHRNSSSFKFTVTNKILIARISASTLNKNDNLLQIEEKP